MYCASTDVIQVHHTRMANGFVIRANGKRLVFSGDTKPCDLLVEEGKDADLLIHEATFEDGHEVILNFLLVGGVLLHFPHFLFRTFYEVSLDPISML